VLQRLVFHTRLISSADCCVFVFGTLRALRLRRLRNFTVVVVAVNGALYAEHLEGCVVHAAAAQLRIHDCRDTAFYTVRAHTAGLSDASHEPAQHLRSRAVVERCVELCFAPMALPHTLAAAPLIQASLAAARLRPLADAAAEGGAASWDAVDDFCWLRATPSPHWRRLSPPERVAPPLLSGEQARCLAV
jgi:hypothetical protein